MNNFYNYISLVLLAITTSCSKNSLPEDEYMNWVKNPENGLSVSQNSEEFVFTTFYEPEDYLLLKNSKKLSDESLQDELSSTQYYVLKIESKSGTDVLKTGIFSEEEYYNRIFYLSDYILKDLTLVYETDTLPCLFAHYERNYGLAPYAKVTFGFERKKELANKSRKIVFEDPVFKGGTLKFNYPTSVFNSIPKLEKKI